jgi:hypothetical protein
MMMMICKSVKLCRHDDLVCAQPADMMMMMTICKSVKLCRHDDLVCSTCCFFKVKLRRLVCKSACFPSEICVGFDDLVCETFFVQMIA